MIEPRDCAEEVDRILNCVPVAGLIIADAEGQLIDIDDIFIHREEGKQSVLRIDLAASLGRD